MRQHTHIDEWWCVFHTSDIVIQCANQNTRRVILYSGAHSGKLILSESCSSTDNDPKSEKPKTQKYKTTTTIQIKTEKVNDDDDYRADSPSTPPLKHCRRSTQLTKKISKRWLNNKFPISSSVKNTFKIKY